MSNSTPKYIPLKMTVLDIAWLAGYLEGEGCFRIHSSLRDRPNALGSPSVKVDATDEDIIRRAASIMGVNRIYTRQPKMPRKKVYTVEAHGQRALDIMTALLPYMGVRRSVAIKEVIRIAALRPGGKPRGEANGQSKLSDAAVIEICQCAASGVKQVVLARRFGVSQALISLVVRGSIWRHVIRSSINTLTGV